MVLKPPTVPSGRTSARSTSKRYSVAALSTQPSDTPVASAAAVDSVGASGTTSFGRKATGRMKSFSS